MHCNVEVIGQPIEIIPVENWQFSGFKVAMIMYPGQANEPPICRKLNNEGVANTMKKSSISFLQLRFLPAKNAL